jgi:chromosome partitioning protein
MQRAMSTCSVCGRGFEPRFRYQVREEEGKFLYFCSQTCQARGVRAQRECACSVCGARFAFEYAFQCATHDGAPVYFCTPGCRENGLAAGMGGIGVDAAARRARPSAVPVGAPRVAAPVAKPPGGPRRIAVFNHKGGTGKTTTAVNLAAGMAERGKRVLLVDADGQGNVGASLGIRGEKTLYHVLVLGMSVEDCVVPVRAGLDVLTSNELLAAAELYLAGRPNRDRILRERLGGRADGYDVVVIDCAPALSLMNQNALVYADAVVVPVSCDYLSLVGVRQVLRTIKNVRELLRHDVGILGVVPTFYDVRNKIAREAVDALTEHFGERCLPPIRVNTKLREAPSARQTIFEYAPDSHGALDYRALVERVLGVRGVGRGGAHVDGQTMAAERGAATVA